ncbi:22525_t:CDS:2 [Gigaspora rosea]|nr:22525_t:CDS:2 [Gigaspora rosea]
MLDIFNKNLEGPLDLKDFVNLKELHCYNINFVSSDVSNSPELKKLYCYKNQYTSLDLKKKQSTEMLDIFNKDLEEPLD